jgi:hypothetical protein
MSDHRTERNGGRIIVTLGASPKIPTLHRSFPRKPESRGQDLSAGPRVKPGAGSGPPLSRGDEKGLVISGAFSVRPIFPVGRCGRALRLATGSDRQFIRRFFLAQNTANLPRNRLNVEQLQITVGAGTDWRGSPQLRAPPPPCPPPQGRRVAEGAFFYRVEIRILDQACTIGSRGVAVFVQRNYGKAVVVIASPLRRPRSANRLKCRRYRTPGRNRTESADGP